MHSRDTARYRTSKNGDLHISFLSYLCKQKLSSSRVPFNSLCIHALFPLLTKQAKKIEAEQRIDRQKR